MNEIKDFNREIDFNNLTYYFKRKINSPINFIGFKAQKKIKNKNRRKSKTI